MRKSNPGSLGYQMMKSLQGIFQLGASRHQAKHHGRDAGLITGISTMRCMSADVHQFARFIRSSWPEVKYLSEVRQEMALAYIDELQQRERSGGRIARVCASLRKLDTACRQAGIFPTDAPALLPYKAQGGPGGFHSKPKPIAYTEEQAQAIITHIAPQNPIVARLLTLMWASGLRVTEAVYLRAQDINLESGMVSLNQEGNVNRTKGGKPRTFPYSPWAQEFMAALKYSPDIQPTGHLFTDRQGLPDRARMLVRKACWELGIQPLATHGYRKTFSVEEYHRARSHGADDRQALLETSIKLGHNRIDVTRQSYVSQKERMK
ncbi:MAG TPA: tyrosine-type recombinase/integrase [Anaerolineales bacterium]|nr:tyrosine-type recombinase/integrase [Anaerolineales bacterium]